MHMRDKGVMSVDDIRPILQGWPYRPGEITVRKIRGDDGREKIQMRVDLGLLQMEATGRPDGQRPHRCESLLHHHLKRLRDYESRNGTRLGFELTPDECSALRDEALMYYQRYLSFFVLEEYEHVERDTARNLRVLDLSGLATVGDAGLEHLAGLSNLERLNLYLTKVTDAGVQHIAQLSNLRWLNLDKTGITDESLEYVKDLSELEWLHVGTTKVSDAGLRRLASLKKLKFLAATRCPNVSEQSAGELKRALPELEFEY